jgi:uncharacterized RDD family membrane protein YckC
MTTLTVQSITGVDIELHIAGPGSRSYAFVIDWHIRFILAFAWLVAAGFLYAGSVSLLSTEPRNTSFWMIVAVPAAAIYLFYHPLLETLMHGRTPGKRMAGVRVVSRQGDIPGPGALLLRNVFRILDSMPLFYVVGLSAVIFTRQHVRIGDLAAGTLLVLDDSAHQGALTRIASVAQARTLDPHVAELVHDLLDRWKSLEDTTRRSIAHSLLLRLDHSLTASELEAQSSRDTQARLKSLLTPKD